jgi:hypothetical protein
LVNAVSALLLFFCFFVPLAVQRRNIKEREKLCTVELNNALLLKKKKKTIYLFTPSATYTNAPSHNYKLSLVKKKKNYKNNPKL